MDVLHDDVRLRLEVAVVVHRDDVRIAERRGRTRFADEALARAGCVDVAEEELERDIALEHGVTGQVERAHASVSQPTLDVITADDVARVQHG